MAFTEDLAYSNTALVNGATDGYAIGDLNWFPDQRATYQWAPTGIEQDFGCRITSFLYIRTKLS